MSLSGLLDILLQQLVARLRAKQRKLLLPLMLQCCCCGGARYLQTELFKEFFIAKGDVNKMAFRVKVTTENICTDQEERAG